MGIEVKNINFKYNKKLILENIGFKLDTGEILAILGPNGIGKTTLLKAIGGLINAKNGECYIEGEDYFKLSNNLRAKYIAYVPQDININFSMTVIDFIMLGRAPYMKFSPSNYDKEKVAQVIEDLNLNEFTFADINELSGGERQRVFIARALAQEAKVIMLDEPTNYLDLKNQILIMQAIKKISKEKGLTFILAIHDLNLASMFCDKFMMIKDREVFNFGLNEEVITIENIYEVYGVKSKIIKNNNFNNIIIEI